MNCATIHQIEDRDWPAVLEMGRQFYNEGGLHGQFVPHVFRRNWEQYIDHGYGLVLCLRRGRITIGTIGGFLSPDPCNDDLVASEAFWFVTAEARGAGLRLPPAFETLAALRGAKRLTMCALRALHANRFEAYYARRGYVPMETHFMKDLISGDR